MAVRKKAIVFAIVSLLMALPAVGQCVRGVAPPSIDTLGVHSNSGRGCVGCHAPHTNAEAANGLWGSTAGPNYRRLRLTLNGDVIETQPITLSTQTAEVDGVVLCLSCHDGNITRKNMSAISPYEQKVGLTRNTGRPPTLLDDGTLSSFAVDHPLGAEATIEVGNGLTFQNGRFAVVPGSPYAQFIANYGWPTLAPTSRSNPYGVDPQGNPYLLCTTCHSQHDVTGYVSTPGSPIAGNQAGQSYSTFFSVNAPYNPVANSRDGWGPSSGVQFCRQCHFNLANEANNALNVATAF